MSWRFGYTYGYYIWHKLDLDRAFRLHYYDT